MPESVFRTLEILLKGAIAATGTKITAMAADIARSNGPQPGTARKE